MITPKDIENKTMSPEKRKSAKNDYFAFLCWKALVLYLDHSVFIYKYFSKCGFFDFYHSNYYWICTYVYWNHKDNADCRMVNVFLWNLLDGVDGNIARYKSNFRRWAVYMMQ